MYDLANGLRLMSYCFHVFLECEGHFCRVNESRPELAAMYMTISYANIMMIIRISFYANTYMCYFTFIILLKSCMFYCL